jgi:DNA-binding beta-propeller fold protein YncE
MKIRHRFPALRRPVLVSAIAASALWAGILPASAQAVTPVQQDITLPGTPFAVTTIPDGQYLFASLSGPANGVAILRQGPASATLVRVLHTGGAVVGLTVTGNGQYLLDTVQPVTGSTPSGMQIIDIAKAISGQPGAILGTVPTGSGGGPIEVALSNDQRFAFVTNEYSETVSVINLSQAIATRGSAASLVGNIPVEQLPVGMAFSPDGRYLYITNEEANPTDPGYNPDACNIPTGVGTGTTPGPYGTLSIISLPQAETNPAHSVLASVYAGCSPVRVVLGDGGQIAWVTARAQDDLLAYSTHQLLADPSHALISTTPVGVAPVGIQLFDYNQLIAVADSNRFTTGQAGSVSILDYQKALSGAGTAATLATFTAGDFPRQWGLSPNGQFLYLTEYSSSILAIFPVPALIHELSHHPVTATTRRPTLLTRANTPTASRTPLGRAGEAGAIGLLLHTWCPMHA